MIGALFFIPFLLPFLAVFGFGWNSDTFVFCAFPGTPLAIVGMVYCNGYKWFDRGVGGSKAAIYETVIDMFKSYPDDWTVDKLYYKKAHLGREYRLHDKITIVDDYRDNATTPLRVSITDPETKETLHYDPKRGYRNAIKRAIAEYHAYCEMKTVVNVALYADEHRSSAGKAVQALNDYREKKGMKGA